MPLKDQFGKKCTGMYRNELFKGLKKRITVLKAIFSTRAITDAGVDFQLQISPRI
jgi:hypothetical protein